MIPGWMLLAALVATGVGAAIATIAVAALEPGWDAASAGIAGGMLTALFISYACIWGGRP